MWQPSNKEEFITAYNLGFTRDKLAEQFSTTMHKVKHYLAYLRSNNEITKSKDLQKPINNIDNAKLDFIKFLSKARSFLEVNAKFGDLAEELLETKYPNLNLFNLLDNYGKNQVILLPQMNQEKIQTKERQWSYYNSTSEFGNFIQPYHLVQLDDELFDNEDESVHIVPIYDAHFGSFSHKKEKFKAYLDWIGSSDNVLTFSGGDLIENALDDGRGFSYEQEITPENQLSEIIEMLAPIAHKMLFMLPGNHEWRTSKRAGIDPTMFIAKTLDIPYHSGPVYTSILGCGNKWRMYAFHGRSAAQTKGGQINAASKPNKFNDFINFFVSGHCFDLETEVLTNTGWKDRNNIKLDDLVVTWNDKTKYLEYNNINKLHEYDNNEGMLHITNGHVDLMVTEDHGMVDIRYNNLEYFLAKDYKSIKNRKFICGGNLDKSGVALSDDILRLIVWIVADGNIDKGAIRFHLKLERKISRLKDLLDRLGIPYTVGIKSKTGSLKIGISVNCDITKNIIKKYFLSGKILPEEFINCNTNQVLIIVEEYTHTDGNRINNNSIQISSSKEKEADLLQAMCVTSGMRCNKVTRKRVNGGNPSYVLAIHQNNCNVSCNTQKDGVFNKVEYNGKVWCLSVDNGTLLVRRNGKVCLTQNCHNAIIAPDTCIVENVTTPGLSYETQYTVVCSSFLTWEGSYAYREGYSPPTNGSTVLTLSADGGYSALIYDNKHRRKTLGSE